MARRSSSSGWRRRSRPPSWGAEPSSRAATAAPPRTRSTSRGSSWGRFRHKERGYSASALTTNSSVVTSLANDFSFEEIFSRQLESMARRGDVLLALSTSGGSPNVIRAVETARKLGVHAFAFSGKGGGRLAESAELAVVVPHDDFARIQEVLYSARPHSVRSRRRGNPAFRSEAVESSKGPALRRILFICENEAGNQSTKHRVLDVIAFLKIADYRLYCGRKTAIGRSRVMVLSVAIISESSGISERRMCCSFRDRQHIHLFSLPVCEAHGQDNRFRCG